MHGARCEALLIGVARVALGFLQGVPTEDGHELPRRGAVVCRDLRARLAQSVRAPRNAGFHTSITEPVSKSPVCERPIGSADQECQVPARRGVDDLLEVWQDRKFEPLWFSVAALELGEGDHTPLCVLLAEPDDVRSALTEGQPERQRQPRLGADGMALLEWRALVHGRGVEAGRAALEILDIAGRIAGRVFLLEPEFEDLTDGLDARIGGFRYVDLPIPQNLD